VARRPPVRVSAPPPPAKRSSQAPVWAVWGSFALAVLGLVDAAYLTFEHYTASSTLACSDKGVIICLKVTTSSYSKVLGIPVALLGLLFFVAMTALCLPPLWRRRSAAIDRLRLAAVCVGMLSVFYLVWAELFKLDAICLFCTGVHVITFLLFALIVLVASGAVAPLPDFEAEPATPAAKAAKPAKQRASAPRR
jgi:uncharacterized membrane protein